MKKIYFLLIALCVFNGLSAQIVNIPDANLKAKLLSANTSNVVAGYNFMQGIQLDANHNGEIEISEALAIQYLDVSNSNISNLTGIQSFVNLRQIICSNNNLTTIDLSSFETLFGIFCSHNLLTSIIFPRFIRDEGIDLSYNFLKTIELPFSNFFQFNCSNNPDLNKLILKDAEIETIGDFYYNASLFSNCPNLKYICVREGNIRNMERIIKSNNYTNCNVNSYCSFVPGGVFYSIQGKNKLDSNTNGCDVLDVIVPNLKFNITNGPTIGSLISSTAGNYSIPVQAGTHTITPSLENSNYFTISPATVNVTFPTQASTFVQDFCVTPNGSHPDLEVTLLPLQPARPGFDAKYKIIYKNKGNTIQSSFVNLAFDDTVLDLVVSNPVTTNQTTNNLSWSFTNLLPFETREITFTLNVNSPMETPAVNNGDVLAYTTKIVSSAIDEIPKDNTFTMNQTVVGSFDPNDKTCLEGTTISPSLIGEYVHYLIRFENTGTYPAKNIVVKDIIDLSKFDISTLVPTKASHSYITKISAGNKVEFIFENINLPFDDANNDGFIAFKIKTKPTLVVNDTFINEASIFFDYNFPIVTNKATSIFKTLVIQDFKFSNYFTLYPNPVNEILNIVTINEIEVKSIAVYNILGQLVIALPNVKVISKIDVSNLKTGNYFIKIDSDKGSSSMKFIKN
ncbi:DUF7619 domain-containing protein [Flavobacterium sp. DSR3-2]|uniref:DUF7619 domain-containing protein n=1 Tax=Flavobacterium sp. DSR3-2 TaxID=2804634 RepID=UPI003CF1ED90